MDIDVEARGGNFRDEAESGREGENYVLCLFKLSFHSSRKYLIYKVEDSMYNHFLVFYLLLFFFLFLSLLFSGCVHVGGTIFHTDNVTASCCTTSTVNTLSCVRASIEH